MMFQAASVRAFGLWRDLTANDQQAQPGIIPMGQPNHGTAYHQDYDACNDAEPQRDPVCGGAANELVDVNREKP